MEANETQSIFEEMYDPDAVRRKDMIPKWIRFFCWLFAILGSFIMLGIMATQIFPLYFNATVYGFSTGQTGYVTTLICGVYVLKLLTAIGLLTEKDWAVKLAIADGIIGLALCAYSIIVSFAHGIFPLRLEIFVLTPYLVIMRSIRKDWEENKFVLQQASGHIV